ncbi:MAG: FixH family protein [Blastocatellia bacterium]|nr:FixH family protein [Blastocatellia bacterium]
MLLLSASGLSACFDAASKGAAEKEPGVERLTKTVFTEKLGAYLVYSALKANAPGDFELHLTDLSEGTPVADAEVAFNVRSKGNQAATLVNARKSGTTGVYAAQVTMPKAGEYYVEVQISHPKFSGRLTMTDFDVD